MVQSFIYRFPSFLIGLMLLAGANAAEQENVNTPSWHEFTSDVGHFSIQFPTEPTTRVSHQGSIIGQVTNHTFESNTPLSRFAVDYSDLPGFAVSFTSDKTIYSHTTGSLLKKTLGKLQSNEDIQYQGHSGKHLIYDIPPVPDKPTMSGQAYLFLIKKRLYVINAIAPLKTSEPQIQHFLKSLRLN